VLFVPVFFVVILQKFRVKPTKVTEEPPAAASEVTS
jgi:hypothetical protein